MTVSITCFHTCDNRGNKEEILSKVPFISNSGKIEWLGKGYYFWTDSDYFAHKWGKIEPRNGNYVITKFQVDIEHVDFLDLVGDVEAQRFFESLIYKYVNTLNIKLRNAKGSFNKAKIQEKISKVAVSTCIQHFRKENKLPFKAIKSQDINIENPKGLKYVHGDHKYDFLPLPTRQQIVVYEEGKDCLSPPQWYFISK